MSFTSGSSSPTHGRRDVGIVAVTTGISYCGDFLAATALTLQAHGAGGLAIAALLLASTVPPILLALVAGGLALLAVAVLGVPVVRAARPVPATAPAPATQPASA
jgi:hypothetical protein